MIPRQAWLGLCVVLLGWNLCAPAQEPVTGQARQLWVLGQEAMRQGKPGEAIPLYEQSLAAGEGNAHIHLSLAAAYVQRGDEDGAARHLAQYVAAFPEHRIVRFRYAELLLHLQRLREAQVQFDRFIADIQDDAGLASKHLLDCHSRLMEIAEDEGDEYGEHLNRGIGLYLLACERVALPAPDDGELSVESILCKAAEELTMARMVRRDEARPCWYLYLVWSRLDQRQPALRRLREADTLAPFGLLTPAEKRDLEMACLRRTAELHGVR